MHCFFLVPSHQTSEMALLPLPALLSRSTCFFCLYLLFQLLFPSSTIPVPASALSHHGQHLFCLMARPGRPTQLPYFQDPYAEELRDCWNAYADADWQSKNCGNKTWYADGLHWHDPKDCHNACKPCINAGIDSWADATVCYREAGTRGSAACQMGYSPRHKQDLVTGSPTDRKYPPLRPRAHSMHKDSVVRSLLFLVSQVADLRCLVPCSLRRNRRPTTLLVPEIEDRQSQHPRSGRHDLEKRHLGGAR